MKMNPFIILCFFVSSVIFASDDKNKPDKMKTMAATASAAYQQIIDAIVQADEKARTEVIVAAPFKKGALKRTITAATTPATTDKPSVAAAAAAEQAPKQQFALGSRDLDIETLDRDQAGRDIFNMIVDFNKDHKVVKEKNVAVAPSKIEFDSLEQTEWACYYAVISRAVQLCEELDAIKDSTYQHSTYKQCKKICIKEFLWRAILHLMLLYKAKQYSCDQFLDHFQNNELLAFASKQIKKELLDSNKILEVIKRWLAPDFNNCSLNNLINELFNKADQIVAQGIIHERQAWLVDSITWSDIKGVSECAQPDIVSVQDSSGSTPLFYAILMNNVACVKLLLDKKSVVNIQNNFGITPLLLARVNRQLYVKDSTDYIIADAIVKLLENHMASLDFLDADGNTPLMNAIIKGALLPVIQAFIHCGANVNYQRVDGKSPMHVAALNDRSDVIESLALNGARLFITDNLNKTPLLTAINNNNLKAAQQICSFFVRVPDQMRIQFNAFDYQGRTPIISAHQICQNTCGTKHRACEQTQMIEYLEKITAEIDGIHVNGVDSRGQTPLIAAAVRLKVDVVELLLKKGANKDYKYNGKTAYQMVCERDDQKNPKVVKLKEMLQCDEGKSVAERQDNKHTVKTPAPTMQNRAESAARDKKETSELPKRLVKFFQGPDVNQFRQLMWSIQKNNVKKVEEIIGDKRIQFADDERANALHTAVLCDRKEIVSLLLNNGYAKNQCDSGGRIPHLLALKDSMKDLLEKNGVTVNAKDAHGNTACHKAAQSDNLVLCQELEKVGGNFLTWNNADQNPLEVALINGSQKVAHWLLKFYDDTHHDAIGRQPLIIADMVVASKCQHGPAPCFHKQFRDSLLAKAAFVNSLGKNGRTPLMTSASAGRPDVAQALLDRGADMRICTADGKRAYTFAQEELAKARMSGKRVDDYTQIITLLESKGAKDIEQKIYLESEARAQATRLEQEKMAQEAAAKLQTKKLAQKQKKKDKRKNAREKEESEENRLNQIADAFRSKQAKKNAVKELKAAAHHAFIKDIDAEIFNDSQIEKRAFKIWLDKCRQIKQMRQRIEEEATRKAKEAVEKCAIAEKLLKEELEQWTIEKAKAIWTQHGSQLGTDEYTDPLLQAQWNNCKVTGDYFNWFYSHLQNQINNLIMEYNRRKINAKPGLPIDVPALTCKYCQQAAYINRDDILAKYCELKNPHDKNDNANKQFWNDVLQNCLEAARIWIDAIDKKMRAEKLASPEKQRKLSSKASAFVPYKSLPAAKKLNHKASAFVPYHLVAPAKK